MDFTYYEKEGVLLIVYGICLSSFLIFLRCWYLILGLFVHLAVMGGVHTADALTKAKAACPMPPTSLHYYVCSPIRKRNNCIHCKTKVLLKTYHNI